MINTGASGAIPRSDYDRMDEHAERFYDSVRKRSGDIEKIAKNTGFSVEDIQKIKDHMFFNEYILDNKRKRFDPNYDQSVSWQRLTDGKDIHEMDIVLLKHELMEITLMSEKGFSYDEAHKITQVVYDYAKYTKELDRKEGVF